MSRWFRFYEGALDDPKVQRLAPPVFKGWVNLLCLASKHKGRLPSLPDIAFALRLSDHEAESLISALMAAGLVEDAGEFMQPHRWYERQFEDKNNAERQRKFRERKREKQPVTRYAPVTPVTVTPLDTDTDTDTEKKDKKGSRNSARVELERVLSEEMAGAVIEHRAKLKAPLTASAAKKLADKLSKIANPDDGASLMLERGWRGFEPEWMTSTSSTGQPSRAQAFWGDTFKKVV